MFLKGRQSVFAAIAMFARWTAELQRNRSKSLDAPSWLWNSVAQLVATPKVPLSAILPPIRAFDAA